MKTILKFTEGDKSNDWTYTGKDLYRGKIKYMICICKCGTIGYIQPHYFKIGEPKSCQKCHRLKISKGDRYGKLTLTGNDRIEKIGKSTIRFVECICDCGNKIWARLNCVRNGNTKSCGCYHKEQSAKAASINNKTHGESKTKFYRIYKSIKARCNNPNTKSFKSYGGRGIKCLRNTYEDFKNDIYDLYINHCKIYGEHQTSIDRINPNGDYCKDNCKRSTRKEQQNNRTNNRIIIYEGNKYTFQQICDKFNINEGCLRHRLKLGWSLERALKEPLHKT